MRIVYNLRDQDWPTTKSLGILNVATRLVRALGEIDAIERLDILANRSLQPHLASLPTAPRCRVHFAAAPPPRGVARALWDHWLLVRACDRLAPDWLLLPKGFAPLLRWPRARVSCLVHDNVFRFYAQNRLPPFPLHERALFNAMLRRTARRADAIVTNSDFTAAEFARDFRPATRPIRIGAPVEPLTPAAPASTSKSASTPAHASGPSLLLPTSAWPHKLTTQALAWVTRWAADNKFSGTIHGYGSLPKGTTWPSSPSWTHHGRIGDADLAALEPRSVLVYFSAYEGYGLPPVEALADGRPAIASDLPPLRETLPRSVLFDNQDYTSFARTLNAALQHRPPPPLVTDSSALVAQRWIAELQRVSSLQR